MMHELPKKQDLVLKSVVMDKLDQTKADKDFEEEPTNYLSLDF